MQFEIMSGNKTSKHPCSEYKSAENQVLIAQRVDSINDWALPRLLQTNLRYGKTRAVFTQVYATGRLMWWDGKLCLCDQRDGQVFMTLDCNIPATRGFQVVTDERTLVLVENRLKM